MGSAVREPELRLVIEGATAEQIERGLAAVRQVFVGAGVHPWDAAGADHRREWLDVCGVYARQHEIEQMKERGADPAEVAEAEAELARLRAAQPDLHDLTEHEEEIAEYWVGAHWAAIRAACPDRHELDVSAELSIVWPDDGGPAGRETAGEAGREADGPVADR